ncbi:Cloroperoxidase, partial [Exidia glandulosa HHB12029]
MSSHEFSPPQLESGDVRSPCPALNALANHSYLPHDGKNISIPTAIRALQAGYNLSWPLAFILALGACILCSKRLSGFDLSDLRLHNAIEHDGSLSRSDTPAGSKLAPIAPDAERLASLLGSGEDLTLDDLAAVRRARDKALTTPLSAMHNRIA